MFKERVTSTALYNSTANMAFENRISGDVFLGDCSFISSMRALLHSRMPEDRKITVKMNDWRGDITAENVLNSANPGDESDMYRIYSVAQETDEVFKALRDGFTEKYAGYEFNEVIHMFFSTVCKFRVFCFSNAERRSVSMFVERLSTVRLHAIQMAILPSQPWYFSKDEKPATPDELVILGAIKDADKDGYLNGIAAISEKLNMRDAIIRGQLAGYETKLYTYQIDGYMNRQAELMRSMQNLQNDYNRRLKEYDEVSTMIIGLQTRAEKESDGGDIMGYFLCNRNLDLISCGNNAEMTFAVKAYIDQYDEDHAESVINNSRGVCSRSGGCVSYERMKKLLVSVFIERKLKIRTVAAFSFQGRNEVFPIYHDHSIYQDYPNAIPQPHTARFRCLGGNASVINRALLEGNHFAALTQCAAAAHNLNWGDTTVTSSFMDTLYNSNCKPCIELPDGKCVTPKVAIEWLEEEEKRGKADKKAKEAGDETNE